MEKSQNRFLAYDVIRAIACLSVLTIHFNASFSGYSGGVFIYPNSILPNHIFNQCVYLGDFGVSLFFILSGATMFHTYGRCKMSLKQFYRKRFLSIYPMFWIAWFVATGVAMLVNGNIASGGPEAAMTTILGFDGYAMALGHYSLSGFYQVGEWFLGCIIFLYLITPLLIWGVKNYPFLAMVVSIIIFIFLHGRVSGVFVLCRVPEVVFGMLFDRCFRPQKNWMQWFWIGGITMEIVFLSLVGSEFLQRGWSGLLCYLISAMFFSVTVLLFQNVKNLKISNMFSLMVQYTYPLFLVHHQVCMYMSMRFNLSDLPKRTCYFAFIVYLCIAIMLSIVLKKASDKLLQYFSVLSISDGDEIRK